MNNQPPKEHAKVTPATVMVGTSVWDSGQNAIHTSSTRVSSSARTLRVYVDDFGETLKVDSVSLSATGVITARIVPLSDSVEKSGLVAKPLAVPDVAVEAPRPQKKAKARQRRTRNGNGKLRKRRNNLSEEQTRKMVLDYIALPSEAGDGLRKIQGGVESVANKYRVSTATVYRRAEEHFTRAGKRAAPRTGVVRGARA